MKPENNNPNPEPGSIKLTIPQGRLPELLYYIESPDDGTVAVGRGVTIEYDKRNGKNIYMISWFNPSHQRRMAASEITRNGNDFSFRRINAEGKVTGTYHLTPMTLELYNNKVKQHLIAPPDFESEWEMKKAFMNVEDV